VVAIVTTTDAERPADDVLAYATDPTSTLATRDPALVADARAAGRLWDVDTGHDLMITEPAAVTAALRQAAGAPVGGGEGRGFVA
jgi:hypothetical protein